MATTSSGLYKHLKQKCISVFFLLRCNKQWQVPPPRGLSANESRQRSTEERWRWLNQILSHSDVLLILGAVVSVLLKTAMHT